MCASRSHPLDARVRAMRLPCHCDATLPASTHIRPTACLPYPALSAPRSHAQHVATVRSCVGHLRASLLGASMHTPGLITLISNLCISCSMERKRLFGVEDLSLVRALPCKQHARGMRHVTKAPGCRHARTAKQL